MSNANDPTPTPATFDWKALIKKVLLLLLTAIASGSAAHMATRSATPAPPSPELLVIAKEFKGPVQVPIRLYAETAGTRVRWRSLDPCLSLIDDLPDLTARKEARAIACKPGRYKVEAWSAVSNEPTAIYQTTVIVGDAPAPVPPNPNPPEPKPVPPNPTPPNPTPPDPTPIPPAPSPLTVKLQLAYAADTSPATVKVGQKNNLQGLYEAMADHAKNPALATLGDLLGDLQKVAYGDGTNPGMIRKDILVEARKVIAAEIAVAMGIEPAAKLDTALRGKATDAFTRIAKSLSEVK